MTQRRKWMGLLLVAIALLTAVSLPGGEKAKEPKIKDFMRAKLTHSQKVLEGLALEDFELIAKHSQEMSLLTLAENWQVLQTPNLLEQSKKFRRAVDTMNEAARKKNLDGAALAYVQATTQCVHCHKYVRGIRMAKAR